MRVFGRHTGLVLAAAILAIPAIAGVDRIEIGTGPGLILRGTPATTASIESAATVSGPWTPLATVTVGPDGRVSMDLSPGPDSRFYRAVSGDTPTGPAGFVWIPPGTFVMGSPIDEVDRYTDEVQHTVTLTQGFWLSDHEVTQAEYQSVMGSNPSALKGDTNRPVEMVTWNDAVLYCRRLTDRERAAGRITAQQVYRLPTEAEWEHAARAGTVGPRHGDLESIAWYAGNSGNQPHPVKQRQPNAWGLYDMIGNVWEWCSDWYGEYPTDAVTDQTGPTSGPGRLSRGGSWNLEAGPARSAYRFWVIPGLRLNYLGFRPALGSTP